MEAGIVLGLCSTLHRYISVHHMEHDYHVLVPAFCQTLPHMNGLALPCREITGHREGAQEGPSTSYTEACLKLLPMWRVYETWSLFCIPIRIRSLIYKGAQQGPAC